MSVMESRPGWLVKFLNFMERPAVVLSLAIIGVVVGMITIMLRILEPQALATFTSEGADLRILAFLAGLMAVTGAARGNKGVDPADTSSATMRAVRMRALAIPLGGIAIVIAMALLVISLIDWFLRLR